MPILSSPCRCLIKKTDCPNKKYPSCAKTCEAMYLFRTQELESVNSGIRGIDYSDDNRYKINYLSMWE